MRHIKAQRKLITISNASVDPQLHSARARIGPIDWTTSKHLEN